MRYATFMTTVEQVAGITREEAEPAVRAVLETLAERISAGEADDIAAFLPEELRPYLTWTNSLAEQFGLDEFIRRVAEREGVDEATAAEHARAVFAALGEAVPPGELRDMLAQLPKEFDRLARAAGVTREPALAEDDVVGRVARITGLDRDRARRAAQAVLRVLAVRISAGEVRDLEPELPAELHFALERGLGESKAATPMTADEFIARVADVEGITLEEAEEHARAVFAALREVVSGKEFSDVAAQLSDDYAPLLTMRR
jgi:uncharacterized protein (DUF2267 family)